MAERIPSEVYSLPTLEAGSVLYNLLNNMENSNNNMNDVECKRMKKNTELLNKGIISQADDSSDDLYDESDVVVESTVNYRNDID